MLCALADPVGVSNERRGRLDSLVADTKSQQRLTPFYRLADLLVQREANTGMDVLVRVLSTRTQHEGCTTDLERITGGDGSRLVGLDHAFLTACTEERGLWVAALGHHHSAEPLVGSP